MTDHDDDTPETPEQRVDDMSRAIRRLVEAMSPHPEQRAAALAWELAAVIGEQAETLDQVDQLLDTYRRVMGDQVRRFGPGRRHP